MNGTSQQLHQQPPPGMPKLLLVLSKMDSETLIFIPKRASWLKSLGTCLGSKNASSYAQFGNGDLLLLLVQLKSPLLHSDPF